MTDLPHKQLDQRSRRIEWALSLLNPFLVNNMNSHGPKIQAPCSPSGLLPSGLEPCWKPGNETWLTVDAEFVVQPIKPANINPNVSELST